jgi:putative ABC transport system permease protein
LWLDVKIGARQIRRAPGVAAAAVLTLAIGIGATTAFFTFVSAILSAGRPVDDMAARVALWSYNRGEAETKRLVSPGDFHDWRARATTLDSMVAWEAASFNLSGTATPIRASAQAVTPGYFEFFKWQPVAGRVITSEDAEPGAPLAVVLSFSFWKSQMAGAPDVVGTTVKLDDEPATIVGVLPRLPGVDGIFVPLDLDTVRDERASRTLFVMARLEPGATLEAARAEMEGVGRALEAEYPQTNRGWTVNTRPLQEEFVGPQARLVFALLVGTALAVLLIGCVNVANLLLARGLARQGEIAVRIAIGAAGWRVVRQLLVECAVLAAIGAGLSLLVARWVVGILVSTFPIDSPWVEAGGLNLRMLAVTAAAAVVATLAAGLVPALAWRRASLLASLYAGGRSGGVASNRRLTRLLVGGEVALAVLLLILAGLFTRTVVAIERLDPGFETSSLLTARVSLPERLADQQASRWFGEALDRVRTIPGVIQAGAASRLPFAGGRFNPNRGLVVEGREPSPGDQGTFAVDYVITPGYLASLRVPIREGRDFLQSDQQDAPYVAIVSETLARRYWPTRSPLGARLRQGDEPPGIWRTVVGVVGDIRNDDADQPPLPYLYLPLAQRPQHSMSMVLRTAGDPPALANQVRQTIASFDANQALYDVRTMDEVLEADLAGSRFLLQVMNAFGALALGLAGLGIWGVVSQLVAQRSREIGVRVALGATTRQVLTLVARLGALPVAGGLFAGLAAGLGLARLMRSLLFQVSSTDPLTIGIACLLLALVAALAVVGPARRAARLDPLAALREE